MAQINLVVDHCKKKTGLSNYSTSLSAEAGKRVPVNTIFAKSYVPKLLNRIIKLCFGINLDSVFRSHPLYIPLPKNSLSHLTSQQQTICLNYLKRDAVVTVHDLIPIVTNSYNSFFAKILYLLAVRGLKKAKFIITVSEYTRTDVARLLNYPVEKINAVLSGVDSSYFKPAKIVRDKFTVLYVGSEMPRKNVMTLFKAFSIAKQKIPQAKLIKVGVPQWRGARRKLIKFVNENNLQDSVVFNDYVENLAEEYQRATLLVFPSKYEGFGFPPLEAMACGCPVICSNATSLPEVVGDSAVLFEPDNVQQLADEIVRLLKNKNLQKHYSAQGIKRARQFTWEKCAKKTIQIYEMLR